MKLNPRATGQSSESGVGRWGAIALGLIVIVVLAAAAMTLGADERFVMPIVIVLTIMLPLTAAKLFDGSEMERTEELSEDERVRRVLGAIGPDVSPNFSGWQGLLKRTFDIVIALTLLLITAPFMLSIALLIRFTSPGPVIFRRPHIGRGKRTFYLYRFRTLRTLNSASEYFLETTKKDGRLIPFGATLRMMALDELPQLFNVLRGDLSLIGPSLRWGYVSFKSNDDTVFAVRPGLIGVSSVMEELRGKVSPTLYARLMDVYYINHWRLTMDLRVAWLFVISRLGRGDNFPPDYRGLGHPLKDSKRPVGEPRHVL